MDPTLTFSYALFMFSDATKQNSNRKDIRPVPPCKLYYNKIERGKTDGNRYSRMQTNERKWKLK